MPPPQYLVRLTAEERAPLEGLIRTGTRAAAVLIHARIMRKADAGAGGPGWDDGRMAEAVEGGAATGYRVRQASVEEGLTAAPFRKQPPGRPYRRLDGAQAAPRPRGGAGGPGGGWPTGWWSGRSWSRSARKGCGRR